MSTAACATVSVFAAQVGLALIGLVHLVRVMRVHDQRVPQLARRAGAEDAEQKRARTKREADERAAVRESLNNEVTLESLLLTDDGLSFRRPGLGPDVVTALRRGRWAIQGELDLHGLTRDEAVARTRAFLAHAARQRWPAVVIVTGKGLHSAEGPVLRRTVERLLDSSRELVLEWGEAPRRFGGAGALAVFLRDVKC